MYVCMYVHMYVCMYVCVCVRVRMYVRMYVCMCVCMCMHTAAAGVRDVCRGVYSHGAGYVWGHALSSSWMDRGCGWSGTSLPYCPHLLHFGMRLPCV